MEADLAVGQQFGFGGADTRHQFVVGIDLMVAHVNGAISIYPADQVAFADVSPAVFGGQDLAFLLVHKAGFFGGFSVLRIVHRSKDLVVVVDAHVCSRLGVSPVGCNALQHMCVVVVAVPGVVPNGFCQVKGFAMFGVHELTLQFCLGEAT